MNRKFLTLVCSLTMVSQSVLAGGGAEQQLAANPVDRLFQSVTTLLNGLTTASESLPFCQISVPATNARFIQASAAVAREGAHACTAADAQAINAAVASQTCSLFVISADDISHDIDLGIQGIGRDVVETGTSSVSNVLVCNGRAEDRAPTLHSAYNATLGSAASLIARVNFPIASYNQFVQAQEEAAAAAEQARIAALADSGVRFEVTDAMRAQALTALTQRLSSWQTQSSLSSYDLRAMTVASQAVCNINMGSAEQGNHAVSATARAGQSNACTAEQAQAISAAIAPRTCAMITAQGIITEGANNQTDIDLFINGEGGTDYNLDPVVVKCNNTDTAIEVSLGGGAFYYNNHPALITRVNFAVGANGDGTVPGAREARALTSFKTQIAHLVQSNYGSYFRGVNFNQQTQPICGARITTDGSAEEGFSAVATSARTGDNACTAEQAQAINAPVRANQCAVIVALPANERDNIDLYIKNVGEFNVSHKDIMPDALPVVAYCNTSNREVTPSLHGRVTGLDTSNALVTRFNVPLRSSRR